MIQCVVSVGRSAVQPTLGWTVTLSYLVSVMDITVKEHNRLKDMHQQQQKQQNLRLYL